MGRPGSFTIKQKITALILGACGVVLFLSASVFVATQIASYKRMLVEELTTVSDILSNNITAAMVFEDDHTAKEILSALKSKPGIVWARIHRPDKSLFVQYQRPGPHSESDDGDALLFEPHTRESGHDIDLWEERIDLQAPITLDGEIIGALLIRSDLQSMYAQIDTYLLLAALTIVVLALIAYLIAARLQKVISEPVVHLLSIMQRVSSDQEYGLRAEQRSDDELGELSEGLNAMLARIQVHDERLRAALQEAESASRAKSEFLANMSHELRTPLNAIIGFSEILKNEILGPLGMERYRYYAQDIFDSGQHLLSVINDILDISKVEAGQFEICEEPTTLHDIAEQSIRLVRERAKKASLKLAVDIQANLPQIYVDPRLIKQCLINLLSNAIKFSPNPGDIVIGAGLRRDGKLAITVTDHGIGIPEEDIPLVLKPFNQVESAFSRSYEGTGLGLPLARSFIEAHGGAMEIESVLGQGTVVTLILTNDRLIQTDDDQEKTEGRPPASA